MNTLRTQYFSSSRNLLARASPRIFASSSSNPVPENTPHTPDSYQKNEEVEKPQSSKTHVVSEHPEGGPRTQRPFEAPSGSHQTTDSSKPYDPPAETSEEDQSKLRYGGQAGSGGGKEDVQGHDSPQGEAGKRGRQ